MRFNLSLVFIFRSLISIYRAFLSGFFGGNCRYEPSCSEYAQQCLERFSFLKASQYIFGRLARCHPFAKKYGYDPVPFTQTHPLRVSHERK